MLFPKGSPLSLSDAQDCYLNNQIPVHQFQSERIQNSQDDSDTRPFPYYMECSSTLHKILSSTSQQNPVPMEL